MYQLGGLANSLADSALTPEERNKWEGIAAEIDNLTAEGKIITGDADKSSPLSSWLESDVSANSVVDFYPEEIEKKTEDVPLQTPVVKGMRLVNANIEYQKKGAKAARDDELKIREQILIEGADELYAMIITS